MKVAAAVIGGSRRHNRSARLNAQAARLSMISRRHIEWRIIDAPFGYRNDGNIFPYRAFTQDGVNYAGERHRAAANGASIIFATEIAVD